MPRIIGVRLTTADGKNSAVAVEYENGAIHLIIPHELAMPSPLEPSAGKMRVQNLLKELGSDLLNIEPDQIIIEWWPSS